MVALQVHLVRQRENQRARGSERERKRAREREWEGKSEGERERESESKREFVPVEPDLFSGGGPLVERLKGHLAHKKQPPLGPYSKNMPRALWRPKPTFR